MAIFTARISSLSVDYQPEVEPRLMSIQSLI